MQTDLVLIIWVGGDLICVNEQNESLWHLLGTLVGSMQGIQKNEGVGTFFLMTKC